MRPDGYEIIYADFPWPRTAFGTAKTPYKTMSWDEIRAWNWGPWLAKRSILFLWSTSPTHVQECAVMWEWCQRFNLRPLGVPFVWVKTRKDGQPLGATGPRPTLVKPIAEYVIALTNVKRGRPFPLLSERMEQWITVPDTCAYSEDIFAPRSRHSRKPPIVRDRIVELLGDRPRVELFAREQAPGWDVWGDEAPVDAEATGVVP